MIVLPAIVFVAGLVLAVAFEMGYTRVEKGWIVPLDREDWAVLYWVLVFVVLASCRIMPTDHVGILHWAPFIAVAVFHVLVCLCGGSFERLRPPPSSKTTGSTPTRGRASDRHSQARDIKSTEGRSTEEKQ